MALKFKVAPLSGTFMITSILGFLISTMYLMGIPGAESYAFALALLFGIMFIASVISMTYAPVEAELAIDESYEIRSARKKTLHPAKGTRKEVVKGALKNSTKVIKKKVGGKK
ncbi:hypothetical protein JXA48_00535 [Candidatus Woesearchaeota archaeon]|nr:hypothetical protein [Candidatus Woesearchaeota archaeon]